MGTCESLCIEQKYVFMFSIQNTLIFYGLDKCAEWEALVYDNIMRSYMSGDKADYFAACSYIGTLHACSAER
jgi:hypothetical protein